MPAVGLAEGFTLSASLARGLNREVQGSMARFPASVALTANPAAAVGRGRKIVLGDLAKTTRDRRGDGRLLQGWIADRIAEDMKANGGIISKDDLAAYQAKERRTVKGTYRGHEIVSMPPPSSGGVALIEMLNVLEPLDLKSKGQLTAPALHLQIEAMRRAYLDRARHLGDPDFVDVPVARLTSKSMRNRLVRRSTRRRRRAASSSAATS
jgi:gamma-glutamyltranspeptidase/glutathione hydrolase